MLADQKMMACSNKDVKRESKTNMYTEVRVWYLKSTRKTIFLPPKFILYGVAKILGNISC